MIAGIDILRKIIASPSTRAIEDFCQRWDVREFALFGSVLREDFRDTSDVDVLVTFDEDAHPTLLSLVRMRGELEAMFGRKVDLLERRGLEQSHNPAISNSVLSSLAVIYAR
jgi:predicted nucleotidyltransferase